MSKIIDLYTVNNAGLVTKTNDAIGKLADRVETIEKTMLSSLQGGTITGNLTVDGTITAKNIATSLPVGTIIWSMTASVPEGFLLCDGSNVSRNTYSALADALGIPKGDASFDLPNLIGKFLQGDSRAGTVKAPGLPNITGGGINPTDFGSNESANATGAFDTSGLVATSTKHVVTNGTSQQFDLYLKFNAHKCNEIYRDDCDTVQPPAVTALPCIKAFDVASGYTTVSMTNLANDINGKESIHSSGDGWIRYNSGLQICWGNIDVTTSTNTTALGNSISTYYGTATITYQQEFKTIPTVSFGAHDGGTGMFNVCFDSITSTTVHIQVYGGTSNITCTPHYIAIGFWK